MHCIVSLTGGLAPAQGRESIGDRNAPRIFARQCRNLCSALASCRRAFVLSRVNSESAPLSIELSRAPDDSEAKLDIQSYGSLREGDARM